MNEFGDKVEWNEGEWIRNTPNGFCNAGMTLTTCKKEPISLVYKHDHPKKHVFSLYMKALGVYLSKGDLLDTSVY